MMELQLNASPRGLPAPQRMLHSSPFWVFLCSGQCLVLRCRHASLACPWAPSTLTCLVSLQSPCGVTKLEPERLPSREPA